MLETLAFAAVCTLIAALVVGLGYGAYVRWRLHQELDATLDELSGHMTEIDELITEAEDEQ